MPSELKNTSWADDDYGEENPDRTFTKVEEYIDENGRRVKATRKLALKTVTKQVNKAVAERKKWAKFGEERGKNAGPDPATTTISAGIEFTLGFASEKLDKNQAEEDSQKKNDISKNIACRICKGEHFTSKCPYKDTLAPPEESTSGTNSAGISAGPGGIKSAGDRYISPALRNRGAGEAMNEASRDHHTLRVTNLSEDMSEPHLHDIFKKYGPIMRIYLATDRDTRLCKGFAFVSFQYKEDADRAIAGVNGLGVDNLILRVETARDK